MHHLVSKKRLINGEISKGTQKEIWKKRKKRKRITEEIRMRGRERESCLTDSQTHLS